MDRSNGDLLLLAQPAFAGGPGASASAGLDQLEQAVADTLRKLKPGRRNVASVHDEMQRLVLTNALMLKLAPEVPPSALIDIARRLRPSSRIGKALGETAEAYEEALLQAGIPSTVLGLLQSWVEMTVNALLVQQQIELKRALDRVQDGIKVGSNDAERRDATELLSAVDFGRALGDLRAETVRHRERAGELFSILRPGRKRGREYPAFQAWPAIAGEPLARILAVVGPVGDTNVYNFFTSPTGLLRGLTPVEALLGRFTLRTDICVGMDAHALLAAPHCERLMAVIHAAQGRAATSTS